MLITGAPELPEKVSRLDLKNNGLLFDNTFPLEEIFMGSPFGCPIAATS
jgi:hypothetical protein